MRSRRSPTRSVGRSSLGCPADRQRVNELAEPFQISKQAVSKHPGARAGRRSRGPGTRNADRSTSTRGGSRPSAWIDRYRLVHEQQFRALDALLAQQNPPQPQEKQT